MILKGNQRSGARDLALHLMKDENDHVQVHEIRGFVSSDLMGAFKESEAQSKGTRCKQYLYSLSLNPPQDKAVSIEDFEKAIDQAEERLGLTGQPRAIVFHEKEGRRHAHAVWSRIDTERMKAVQLSHSKRKLNELSKQLYLDHGWRLPAGHIDHALRDPLNFTLEEWQQAKRINKDPREIKQVFQDAWEKAGQSEDHTEAFKSIMSERGYQLAKGNRRALVAMDRYGEVYSLPRQLGLKSKEVRAVLSNTDHLLSVDRIKEQANAEMIAKLEGFKQAVQNKAEAEKQAFKDKLITLVQKQREQRHRLQERQEARQLTETKERQSRFRKGLKGAWDFLRGENARIAKQNKAEALAAEQLDRKEQENLIQAHLWERRELQKTKARVYDRNRSLKQQHIDLEQEIERVSQRQRAELNRAKDFGNEF